MPRLRSAWSITRHSVFWLGIILAAGLVMRIDRLGDRVAREPVGAAARRRARAPHPRLSAWPRAHLSQSVRRASAVPDRRQFWRYARDRGNADAEPWRRDAAAARAAERLACRVGDWAACAGAVFGRSALAGRRTGRGGGPWRDIRAACGPARHAAGRGDADPWESGEASRQRSRARVNNKRGCP